MQSYPAPATNSSGNFNLEDSGAIAQPLVPVIDAALDAILQAETPNVPPAFPIPKAWEPFTAALEEIASAYELDFGAVATVALGMLSVSVGAGAVTRGAVLTLGAITPANLYVILCMPSGEGKSEIFKFLQHPVNQFERSLPTIKLQNAKGEDAGEQAREFIFDDTTPEAFIVGFAPVAGFAEPYLALISSDARKLWSNFSGRYARSGTESGDFDALLKCFSGDMLKRKRRGGGNVWIEKPCASLVIGLQDDLRDSISSEDAARSGFLGRCLIASFEKKSNQRDPKGRPALQSLGEWDKAIKKNFGAFFNPDKTHVIDGRDCFRMFTAFHNTLDKRRSELVGAFAQRGAEQAVRIATALHATQYGAKAGNVPLDPQTAEDAIRIVEWFAYFVAETKRLKEAESANKILNFISRRTQGATVNEIRRFTRLSRPTVAETLRDLEGARRVLRQDTKADNGRIVALWRVL